MFKLVFYVVPYSGPPLLGRDGMRQLGMLNDKTVHIDLNNFEPAVNKSRDSKTEGATCLVIAKNSSKPIPNSVSTIVQNCYEVFDNQLGTFTKYQVSLDIAQGPTPKFFKAHTLPITLKCPVENEPNRLIALGILKKVDYSQWATPIVAVLKPDGSVRICGDYRLQHGGNRVSLA